MSDPLVQEPARVWTWASCLCGWRGAPTYIGGTKVGSSPTTPGAQRVVGSRVVLNCPACKERMVSIHQEYA